MAFSRVIGRPRDRRFHRRMDAAPDRMREEVDRPFLGLRGGKLPGRESDRMTGSSGGPPPFYHSNYHYWDSFCSKAVARLNWTSLPVAVQEALGAACSLPVPCGQRRLDHRFLRFPDKAAGRRLLHVLLAAGRGLGGHRAGQGRLRLFMQTDVQVLQKYHRLPGIFQAQVHAFGNLGSTWHPLPMIQIDETATPIYALPHALGGGANVMMLSALYEPL